MFGRLPIITAPHISKPILRFEVVFYPEFTNNIYHEDEKRTVEVWAENEEKAIEVAQYHYSRGEEFEVFSA